MKVGPFIPCYLDAFFPEVGVATLELPGRLGCSAEYPPDQTCGGQPTANGGCQEGAAATEALFVRRFQFNTNVNEVIAETPGGGTSSEPITLDRR